MSTFNGYFTERDDVLENRLGISDPEEMQRIEAEIVPLRIAELLAAPPDGEIDYRYLCLLHERIFGDLYPMAGKTRTVDIAKGESAFCYVPFIDDEQRRIFRQLKQRLSAFHGEKAEAACLLAWFASELNALHPFREGNGRAIRVLMILLAERLGYHLDYSLVDDPRRMQADIAAFLGSVRDLEQVYFEMLEAI